MQQTDRDQYIQAGRRSFEQLHNISVALPGCHHQRRLPGLNIRNKASFCEEKLFDIKI
jgi:hypothetical protein